MGQLYCRRNAALLPVVHALGAALLFEAKQLSNLGGAAQAINQFTIHSDKGVGFHAGIKHHV